MSRAGFAQSRALQADGRIAPSDGARIGIPDCEPMSAGTAIFIVGF
jgi:hypothetical protein